MTDNERIAKFMGWEIIDRMPISKEPIYSLPHIDTSLSNLYFGPHRSEQMNFDSDWSWIMPVVGKIESLGFTTKFRYGAFTGGEERSYLDIEIFALNENNGYKRVAGCTERIPKIQAVYKAVVEFIKWFETREGAE